MNALAAWWRRKVRHWRMDREVWAMEQARRAARAASFADRAGHGTGPT